MNPLAPDLRCIAAARTLLFNYGQNLYTPYPHFFGVCKVLGCSSDTKIIPDLQPVKIPISFFSKHFFRVDNRYHPSMNELRLYSPWEEKQFLALPSVVKLNWVRNFYWMRELLFNFTPDQHDLIADILQHWNRPSFSYEQPARWNLGFVSDNLAHGPIPTTRDGITTYSNRRDINGVNGYRQPDEFSPADI